jgi:TRAP-type C4-dicarboxylate transport system permease small subunit
MRLKFFNLLEYFIVAFCSVSFLVMVLVIGLQVFARYLLNDSPAWTESLALFLLTYLVLLGSALGVRKNAHMGLYFVVENLPGKLPAFFEVLVTIIMLSFGATMAYYGYELMQQTAEHLVPTLGLSKAWSYFPVVLGGILIVLFCIEKLLIKFSAQRSTR